MLDIYEDVYMCKMSLYSKCVQVGYRHGMKHLRKFGLHLVH